MFVLLWNVGYNVDKMIDSGGYSPTSFEGLGMMGLLLYFYFIYLLIFIIWLFILNSCKNTVNNKWKLVQLIPIFIFSIIPTILIEIVLIYSAPNPFKQYPKVQRLEHEIENGVIIRYSEDSVKLYEATVVNDKIVGEEIERYKTGEIKSIQNYKDGVLDGESVYYYKNGNKSESRVYKLGQSLEIKAWFENSQMSYFYNHDSLYRYRWWDNGQLQELYYNGYLNSYWEKDGTQTLSGGGGRVTFWHNDNPEQKSSETIYRNSQLVKETTWSLNGNKSRQDEFIQLSKEESKKIDFYCEFKGFKKMLFYEDGTIKRITYWSTDHNCKIDGHSTITYEYTQDGKLKDVHY